MTQENQLHLASAVEAARDPNPYVRRFTHRGIRRSIAFSLLVAAQCLPSSAQHLWPILLDKVDMDGDGTTDFELRRGFTAGLGHPPDPNACFRAFGVEGHGLHTLQNNRVLLATTVDCFGALESLAPGTLIGPSLLPHQSWGLNGDSYSVTFSPIGNHQTNGPLATATNALVGVQFSSPKGTHYGWVEITSPAPGQPPKIVRFAAEGAPSTPIPAGANPATPFSAPLIPLRVPPSDSLIGGILVENSTNTSTGKITRRVEVKVSPEIECLVGEGRSSWPTGSYPAPLTERTFLPKPLPKGMSWKKPGENLRLFSRTEESNGTVTDHYGPLSEAESILIGFRKPAGETWWVEFQRSGTVTFASHSTANSAELLVGHPSITPDPAEVKYIDINGDGFIEFVASTTSPVPGDVQHRLHPLRGQKTLTPSNVNRLGTQISLTHPSDSSWSESPATLMHVGSSSGPFGGTQYFYRSIGIPNGTNGYIAVQFKEGPNTHVGWIQYNRYEIFLGVMGMSPLISPTLDYFDHGYQRTAGAPATIGTESSLPLALQIQEEGNQLRLRWDPLRRNSSRLEISTSIVSPSWAPATSPGTDNLLYPKPESSGPLFFRLQPVAPNPPVVRP